MANELSTLGITVHYAVESTAGTRPTTGYTKVAHIKATPDFAVPPEGIEVTDLEETDIRRYVPGLRDLGDSLSFTANLTSDLITAWETAVTAANTAWSTGKSTWWEIKIPKLNKSFYFAGLPVELGMSALEVNAALETECVIAPTGFEGFATPSTT